MAAIGDGWVENAWIEAGWAAKAWFAITDQDAIGDGWIAGAWIMDGWVAAPAPGGAWAVGGAVLGSIVPIITRRRRCR